MTPRRQIVDASLVLSFRILKGPASHTSVPRVGSGRGTPDEDKTPPRILAPSSRPTGPYHRERNRSSTSSSAVAPYPLPPPPGMVLVYGTPALSHRSSLGDSRHRGDHSEVSPGTEASLDRCKTNRGDAMKHEKNRKQKLFGTVCTGSRSGIALERNRLGRA